MREVRILLGQSKDPTLWCRALKIGQTEEVETGTVESCVINIQSLILKSP